MILARFWDSSGVAHNYPDIWDISIDAESASGVDFFQQEGRQASFSVKADGWLARALIDPEENPIRRYLPYYIEIVRDGVVIFGGFTQAGNHVEDRIRRQIITVTVYDAICVIVDMNEGEERAVTGGQAYSVIDEIEDVMPVVVGNCEELFGTFGVSWLNAWVESGLVMGFRIWLPRWKSGEDVNPSIYNDVIERRLTAHQVGSEWWLEWIDCTSVLEHEISEISGKHKFYYRQNLIWLRLKLDESGVNLNTGVASHDQKTTHSVTFSNSSTDEEYLRNLAMSLMNPPDIRTGYGIPGGNSITSITIGDASWRIVTERDDAGVAINAEIQKYVNPADEFVVERDTETVGLMAWLGGLLRVVCGYLAVSGRTIDIRNRLDYPGSTPVVIQEDDLISPVRMTAIESTGIDADYSFLEDGEDVVEGIQEFYDTTVLGALPREFEMELVGRDWALGMTVQWRDWLVIVTSVERDPIRNWSRIRGMGGR